MYSPMMKTLQDQVTYLGHDLNAGAANEPEIGRRQTERARRRTCTRQSIKVTETASANIAKLSAE